MRQPYEYLMDWLSTSEGKSQFMGQVELSLCPDSNKYRARHSEDRAIDFANLECLKDLSEISNMAKFDAEGQERPLRTAPTLVRGWFFEDTSAKAFCALLDAIYPMCLDQSVSYFEGHLAPTPFRSSLDQHSSNLNPKVSDAHTNQIMRETCAKGCLKTIGWPIDEKCAVSRLSKKGRTIPMICSAACSFALSDTRRLVD